MHVQEITEWIIFVLPVNSYDKLDKIYFVLFLLFSDERKIDQLLHETDGSRQMANQIVHRVFRQQGCKQDKCVMGSSVSIMSISG